MGMWGDIIDDTYDICDGCGDPHQTNADNLCTVCAELDREGLLWT